MLSIVLGTAVKHSGFLYFREERAKQPHFLLLHRQRISHFPHIVHLNFHTTKVIIFYLYFIIEAIEFKGKNGE